MPQPLTYTQETAFILSRGWIGETGIVEGMWLCILLYLFKRFFLTWTMFKVFTEFVTVVLLFYALAFWPQGMWDPSP